MRRSLPAFSDDSGLAVDALDGEPGIYSARWAGPRQGFPPGDGAHRCAAAASAARRRRQQRKAHFVSALCVAWPDGHVEEFEARVDGTLVWPPRGEKGFGYDPMFLPDGHTRTFGEMDSIEKHGLPPRGKGLSHRARAFVKLAQACLGRALTFRTTAVVGLVNNRLMSRVDCAMNAGRYIIPS